MIKVIFSTKSGNVYTFNCSDAKKTINLLILDNDFRFPLSELDWYIIK